MHDNSVVGMDRMRSMAGPGMCRTCTRGVLGAGGLPAASPTGGCSLADPTETGLGAEGLPGGTATGAAADYTSTFRLMRFCLYEGM